MICRVDGCGAQAPYKKAPSDVVGHGLCLMHRHRLARYGDPHAVHRGGRMPGGLYVTSCAHGHQYTPENTWIDSRGWRYCRDCQRASVADAVRRNRGESVPSRRVERVGCCHGHGEEHMIRRRTDGARICKECRRVYQRRLETGEQMPKTPLIDESLRGHGWNARPGRVVGHAPASSMYHAVATKFVVPKRGSGVPQEKA